MRRYRVLLTLWAITIAAFAIGFLGPWGLSVGAQFFAFILAGVSVKSADKVGELRGRKRWIYRIAMLILLGAAGTVLVAAGTTVAYGDRNPLGFVALGSTNLLIAVLTWRALTRPAPRRAAVAGLLAVVLELVALIFDIVVNLEHGWMRDIPDDIAAVAVFASWAATWAGALVCVAALVSFDPPDAVDVPDARVVD